MNNQRLYYTAPSEEAFAEMKAEAIKLWQTYDNTWGYVEGKVNTIKDMKNIKDNFMYIFAMFDYQNQQKIISVLSPYVLEELNKRIIDGQN